VVVEPTPLSANNPRIAALRRLTGRRRARLDAGQFVIEGPMPVAELLEAGAGLTEIYVDADAWVSFDDRSPLRGAVRDAIEAGIPVWSIAPAVFESVSDTATPQGVMALAPRTTTPITDLASRPGPVLVLVDISDPGNAGTLVRAAEAAGCAGVVFAGSCTDPYGPKTVRAAAGSLVRLPIAEESTAFVALVALRDAGRTLVATVVDGGDAPESLDLAGEVAIVLGSEAHGLDADVVDRCDQSATIPMDPAVESINVAIAGAVVLFEAARQRRVS
jgi:TrmH family RNA methyltransferase